MGAKGVVAGWSIRSTSVIQSGRPHLGLVVWSTRPLLTSWHGCCCCLTFCWLVAHRQTRLCGQIFTFTKENFNSNMKDSQAALLSIPTSFLSLSLSEFASTLLQRISEKIAPSTSSGSVIWACCSLPLHNQYAGITSTRPWSVALTTGLGWRWCDVGGYK